MGWFNFYGLIFICVIMIPNVVFAMKVKDGFENKYKNKIAKTLEQIGRFGCFALMIFNIPYTYFGFYFGSAEIVYIIVNSVLTASYCLIWAILWNKKGLFRSILLSVIPSAIFVFSGIMILSAPLMVLSLIFAPTHILISVKNAE